MKLRKVTIKFKNIDEPKVIDRVIEVNDEKGIVNSGVLEVLQDMLPVHDRSVNSYHLSGIEWYKVEEYKND